MAARRRGFFGSCSYKPRSVFSTILIASGASKLIIVSITQPLSASFMIWPMQIGEITVEAVVRSVFVVTEVGIFAGALVEQVDETLLAIGEIFLKQTAAVLGKGLAHAIRQVAGKDLAVFFG